MSPAPVNAAGLAASIAASHTADSHFTGDGWMDGEAAGSEGSVTPPRRDEKQINYPSPMISGTPAQM